MPKAKRVPLETVLRVLRTLESEYPDARTELTYESPFQLLIAVILSAQCTDARVNQVTPALFKLYPTAERLAKANASDVEELIRSCGFYKMKTKAILGTSRDLIGRFSGKV